MIILYFYGQKCDVCLTDLRSRCQQCCIIFWKTKEECIALHFPTSRECQLSLTYGGFPGGSDDKESACSVGDLGSIPELGRSPGEGNGYPLQYFVLESSMSYTVDGVTKRWTQLSDFLFSTSPQNLCDLIQHQCTEKLSFWYQ